MAETMLTVFRRWPNLAGWIDTWRARIGLYWGWHREVRRCFKETGRAARLHRMLPLLILPMAVIVANVWAINRLAGQLVEWMAAVPGFFAHHLGVTAFYGNGYSLLAGVAITGGVTTAVRCQMLPDIRSSSGWQKAANTALLALFIVWCACITFVTATSGVASGVIAFLKSLLGMLMLAFWASAVMVFIMVFVGWFWLTKVVNLRWPWLGWLVIILAWYFSVDIARFLAENTRWLYPPNLHHTFDVVAVFGITAVEWYIKLPATVAAVVPWVVEFRVVCGLKRHGASFRDGEYYLRWCKSAPEEFPRLRQTLKQFWTNLRNGGSTPPQDVPSLSAMYRQLFHDVLS